MKKFLSTLMVAVTATLSGFTLPSSTVSQEQSISLQESFPSGKALFEEIQKEYQEGKAKEFLTSVDKSYRQSSKKWNLDDLLSERKKMSEIAKEYNVTPTQEKKEAAEKDAKKTALLELSIANPGKTISEVIKNANFFTLSKKQQESVDAYYNLASKFKGDGKSPLENELIKIDIEYWVKSITLNVKNLKEKSTPIGMEKSRILLEMEKLDKMTALCQKYPEEKLAKDLLVFSSIYPQYAAAKIDRSHLHYLAAGILKPQNEVESKVVEILGQG